MLVLPFTQREEDGEQEDTVSVQASELEVPLACLLGGILQQRPHGEWHCQIWCISFAPHVRKFHLLT